MGISLSSFSEKIVQYFWNHLKQFDWLLLGAIFLLNSIGLVSLFSLSERSPLPFFHNQITWLAIGLFLFFLASLIDYRFFRNQSFVLLGFYILTVILLSALFFFGEGTGGVARWFYFGGIAFQPVEPAKPVLVLILAKYFSLRHAEIYRLRHLIISGIYILIPAILVLFQPNLGSAAILLFLWTAIAIFSGIKMRHFIFFVLLLSVVSLLAWNLALAPYQKSRITSFINPYSDPLGTGYNAIQAKIAVGSGKIFGKGVGYGSQSSLNFLPAAETDFIFSAFTEEWGLVGALMLFGGFAVLFWRIIKIGLKVSDNFSRLFTLGFASIILSQFIIHVGMNIGLMPITGITLPFVSYGGSSLVSLMIGIGILQNIKINSRREIE